MKNWKNWTLGVIFLVLANSVYAQNKSDPKRELELFLVVPRDFRVNRGDTFALFRTGTDVPGSATYYIVRYTWDNTNNKPRFETRAFQIELLNIEHRFRLFGLNTSSIEYNTLTGRLNGQMMGGFSGFIDASDLFDISERPNNGLIMSCGINFNNASAKILFQMDMGIW